MGSAKPRLAVVDDDARSRSALEHLLRAEGFKVDAFSCAEEFLANPLPSPPACLILDPQLPGLSGFGLCEHVRPSAGEPAVIFLTAQDNPAARARAERLGAEGYVLKPFVERSLLDVVSRAIAKPKS